MQLKRTLFYAILVLGSLLYTISNAFGVTLTVENADVDARLNNTVSVNILVDDPSEIIGAAFTVFYDTNDLDLISVESEFFDTFANQFSTLPGAGTPFVDPTDGKTYIPITNDEGTVNVPLEITIDGDAYSRPLLIGPETQTGNKIVAGRVQAGEQANNVLFTLTFDISSASERDYLVQLIQSRINNPDAGYDASGEPIPMLLGPFDFDLKVFPDLPIEQINAGKISVNKSDGPGIVNKPVETITVEAGQSSGIFTVAGGDGELYTWTVMDGSGNVIDSQTGDSYAFTAPATGAYAGAYSVAVTDNQAFTESFTVNVPITITPETLSFTEVKLDGADNPQYFTVDGADGDYIWEILDSVTALQAVSNPDEYGSWDKPSPVFSDNTNVFRPADVAAWQPFYVRVTVLNDDELTEVNGLNSKVAGPFTIMPVDTFRVVLGDNYGIIDGTQLTTGDIVVTEVSTNQVRNGIAYNGEVSFILPDVGSTFQYQVKDTRIPPVYVERNISSSAKEVQITLDRVGPDSIAGIVEDVNGLPLANATVQAYQPANSLTRYKTITASDGSYVIDLPVGTQLNGWSVVVGLEDYLSRRKDEQTVGTVDFTDADGLYTETTITNIIATVEGSSVRLDITAKPAIVDPSEVDIALESGNGHLSDPVLTDNIEPGATVTLTYSKIRDFVVRISVDTTEDHDPFTGYAATRSLTYNGDNSKLKASAQSYNGNNGVKTLLSANDQTAEVEVPAGGVATESTIVVEQYLMHDGFFLMADKVSSSYAYDVTAMNFETGAVLSEDEINYVEITLPIDLRVVKPGDFENGTWVIRHAHDLAALEAGDFTVEPFDHIISTDYVGDGRTGSITFYVTSLSIFDLASSQEAEGGGSVGDVLGCFINTASHGSLLDFYAASLERFREIYRLIME